MFTLQQMLAQRQAALAAAEQRRDQARTDLAALAAAAEQAGRTNLTAEEDARASELIGARRAADAEIETARARVTEIEAEITAEAEIERQSGERRDTAPRPTGGARVTSEPEVYRKGGDTSYFRDLYRASQFGDRTSVERLARNDKQVRALTTVDGAGGDFVPPTWMTNQFVNLARAGRVVADQVGQQPLPAGTDTISLPRLATGTAVAEQSTQNSALQNTDATTSSVSAAVTTIAGQQVISQQLLDQSPVNMDNVLSADLAADYAIKIDTFVIANSATNKVGLLNVSGLNAVTYTDASPTPGELYAKVADAIQQVHTGRFMPADKVFMHPRRWAWFLAALDTAGRPLVTPDAMNSIAQSNGVTSQGRVGVLQGLDVYVDPNIPVNLGAGTNEDRIIVLRSADVILYEGTPKAETFRETYAQNLSVMLRFYNYAAIHASRLPKAVSVIAGTGLIAPTF